MYGCTGHIERVEVMMEAMARKPDRVFHELYLIFIFEDCVGLEAMPAPQRSDLMDAVAMAVTTILCPPVTVKVIGGEVYLLVQQNPNRSIQDIADAGGSPLPAWEGDYSCLSIGADDVESVTAAINDGSIAALLASWHDQVRDRFDIARLPHLSRRPGDGALPDVNKAARLISNFGLSVAV